MRTAAALVATVVAAVTCGSAWLTGAQTGTALPAKVRLTAFAVNMSNVGTGRNAVVEIDISQWTTPDVRASLISTFLEKGPRALLGALSKQKSHGRMRIPGWTGPDPHNVRLGWDLHYTWQQPLDERGHRIVVATDRYIGFWEARNQPRSTDYPFTLMEIRLDRSGVGVGKLAAATRITFDKKKNHIEIENFASEPIRLQQVRMDARS